jgi:hypothetical protein
MIRQVIWKNRLVKMLDFKTWEMSRIGEHDDFDYMSDREPATRAVAGSQARNIDDEARYVDDVIEDLFILDEDRLVFVVKDGFWVLRGDPCVDGSLSFQEDDPRAIGGDLC